MTYWERGHYRWYWTYIKTGGRARRRKVYSRTWGVHGRVVLKRRPRSQNRLRISQGLSSHKGERWEAIQSHNQSERYDQPQVRLHLRLAHRLLFHPKWRGSVRLHWFSAEGCPFPITPFLHYRGQVRQRLQSWGREPGLSRRCSTHKCGETVAREDRCISYWSDWVGWADIYLLCHIIFRSDGYLGSLNEGPHNAPPTLSHTSPEIYYSAQSWSSRQASDDYTQHSRLGVCGSVAADLGVL